jgi:hypothetical protein
MCSDSCSQERPDKHRDEILNLNASTGLLADKKLGSLISVKRILKEVVKDELSNLLFEAVAMKRSDSEATKLAAAMNSWYGNASVHKLGMGLMQLRANPIQYANLMELSQLTHIPITTVRRPKFKRLLQLLSQSELIVWQIEGKRHSIALNWSNERIKCLLPLWREVKQVNATRE